MRGNEIITITKSMRRAIMGLLILVLIVGGGNLWATFEVNSASLAAEHRQAAAAQRLAAREQAAQQRQGRMIVEKLCTGFGKLAALKPPAGANQANPSRLFELHQHNILDSLGSDIGCSKKGGPGAAGH